MPRFTFANVTAVLALTIAVGTGTAAAAYVLSSNSQIGPGTVSGGAPPSGDHANVIAGSIAGADLAAHAIGAGQLASPEGWHTVAPNPGAPSSDPCGGTSAAVGIFCGAGDFFFWENVGGGFAPAAYYRDLEGQVRLRGLVSLVKGPRYIAGTYGETQLFYLPATYRPSHELVFATLDNDRQGSYLARVDITPSGLVQVLQDRTEQFLSLDGIAFRAGE